MSDSDTHHTEPVTPERRRFLIGLSAGMAGLAGLLIGIPFIGFLIAPVRRPVPDVWRPVGAVDDFRVGEMVKVTYLDPEPLPWAGFIAESTVWVDRTETSTFVALSMYCTHTGCPVEWAQRTGLFFCPCHGGAFNRDGSVAAGPPPSALPRHETRVRDGQLEIRTRRIPLPPRGA
jgi:menaquinol-cytochrome c reductase iron-sulfur subunit